MHDGAIVSNDRQLYSGVVTAGGQAQALALSNTAHNLSSALGNKFYFEVNTVDNNPPASGDSGIGVDINPAQSDPNNLSLFSDGNIYNASTVVHTMPLPAGLNGTTGIAVGNGQIWFRQNGGPWNGNPSADPSQNTGGFSLPANVLYAVAGQVYAGPGGYATMNINTGPQFIYPPPDGFAPWTGDLAASAASPNPPRMDTVTMPGSAVAPGSVTTAMPRGVFPGWQPRNEISPC